MIRKAIIGVLTLATLGTGLIWTVSWTVQGPEFKKFDAGTGVTHVMQRGTIAYHLQATRGTLAFQVSKRRSSTTGVPPKTLGIAGFSVERYVRTMPPWGPSSNWVIRVPFWALFSLFACYPTFAFIRGPLRRWRRRRRGLCLNCAYDLRGSTDRCPECGTEIRRESVKDEA